MATAAPELEPPQEAPELSQQADVAGSPDPLENDEVGQAQLKALVRKYATQDKMVRRLETQEASLQRFYNKGYQHIWWDNAAGLFAIANGASAFASNDDSTDMPRYMETYNIYGPYGRISSSVLTQNPPGVNFEPDDPSKSVDIDAAKAAEAYRHFIDRTNQRKKLQSQIADRFWTDSRVVTYTRLVQDADRFGEDETGEPRKVALIEAFGVLETKVPITARSRAEFPYCIILDDLDINIAKELFPEQAQKIQTGPSTVGESAYERYARLGALQGTNRRLQPGDAYQHLATRHRVWLRPAAFNDCADAVRDKFKQIYPKGCFVTFCGDAYCGSREENMDDHIAVGFPRAGDGMNRPSLGKDGVALQDAVNDYKNQEKEYLDYGIGATWCDSALVDNPAVREQISQPGNRYSVPLAPGGVDQMASHFFSEPPAECPPSLIQAYQDMRGAFAQFVLGAPPAIWGGGDAHQETAKGIQILRDQAMGQASIPWGAMQEIFAECYRQAVKAVASVAEDETVTIALPGKNATTVQVTIADMARGNFHCIPDTDSNFPQTWGAKRETWMQFLEAAAKNPALADVLNQPDNLEEMVELSGLDIVIPGAEARNKQLAEIEMLLKTQPIPPDPQAVAQYQQMQQMAQAAQGAGQPAPPLPPPPQPEPSVPIDPVIDLHNYEFLKCQEWLNSQERRDAEKNNPQGVVNVRLHALKHYAAMQQQAQQAAQQHAKPPSVSIATQFKDLPPAGQIQAAAQEGIQLTAQDVGMQQLGKAIGDQ